MASRPNMAAARPSEVVRRAKPAVAARSAKRGLSVRNWRIVVVREPMSRR
jgi:hypothetical protein